MEVVVANYEDRYSLLHGVAAKYVDVDNERASSIVRKAEAVAFASRESLLIIKSQRLKGQILFKLGQPETVISFVQPLLQNSSLESLGYEYLSVVNLLGVCHLTIG